MNKNTLLIVVAVIVVAGVAAAVYSGALGGAMQALTGSGSAPEFIGPTPVLIELCSGKGYPYNPDDKTGIYDYKVSLTKSSNNRYVTSIIIGNSAQRWTDQISTNGPLYAPDDQCLTGKGKAGESQAIFMKGKAYYGVEYFHAAFDGFEQDEPITTMKFEENKVTYTDASGATHSIPLYIELTKVTSGSSFTFDGRTIYYATDTNNNYLDIDSNTSKINSVEAIREVKQCGTGSTTITLGDGTQYRCFVTGDRIDINGAAWTIQDAGNGNLVRINADMNFTMATSPVYKGGSQSGVEYLEPFSSARGKTIYVSDGNKATDRVFTGAPVKLKGTNDVTYDYVVYTDPTAEGSYLWLLLAGTTNFTPQYSKDIFFTGTDYAERGAPHVSYYWRDAEKFGGASDSLYYLAQFGIDTNEDGYPDANIFYDTYTNKLFAFPNTNLSVYDCDVNYHGEEGTTRAKWCLDDDPATIGKPTAGYGDFGEKYVLSKYIQGGGALTISIPENIARAILRVGCGALPSTQDTTYKSGESAGTVNLDSYPSTNEFPNTWAGNSQLPCLYNDATTGRREYVGVDADARFDYGGDGGASDLEMYIASENDLNYTVNLANGIPIGFKESRDGKLEIPFFGQKLRVYEITANPLCVKLVKP